MVAFSLAYETELAGVVDCLDLAGIPALAEDRAVARRRPPLVVIGGPLTFSNPVPAGPFADVILLGEAEDLIVTLVHALRDGGDAIARAAAGQLATLPGFYVPAIHGEAVPPIAAADDSDCPPTRRSARRTPSCATCS